MNGFNPLDTAARKLMTQIRQKKIFRQLALIIIKVVRRQWSYIFKMLGRKCLLTTLYEVKNNPSRIKMKQRYFQTKLREFVTSSSALKKALKGVPWAKEK